MSESLAPRVLLGNLEPILLAGLRRVLAEDGIEVIGQEQLPRAIVTHVGTEFPDVLVLDLNGDRSRELAEDVRRVSPHTKVILWARDETLMEVLDPGSSASRLVVTEDADELRKELVARHQVKE